MSASDTPVSQSPGSSQVAVFTMKQAAQVAGISVSTLRRRRAELEAAGAVIGPDRWQVPITALEAVGLMRSPAPVRASLPASLAPDESLGLDALREAQERIQKLEADIVELRHRAELAEAIARERAEALNAERMALRMIAASPSSSGSSSPEEEKTPSSSVHHQQATSTSRPSWLKRKFG